MLSPDQQFFAFVLALILITAAVIVHTYSLRDARRMIVELRRQLADARALPADAQLSAVLPAHDLPKAQLLRHGILDIRQLIDGRNSTQYRVQLDGRFAGIVEIRVSNWATPGHDRLPDLIKALEILERETKPAARISVRLEADASPAIAAIAEAREACGAWIDADLVRRAVVGAHLADPAGPRAVIVARRFGLGATLARELCVRFGKDPDEILGNQRPSAPAVFLQLLEILMADNGGQYEATPDDHEAAIPLIEQLIDAGFFRDDPNDMDGSFWQAAAGEYSEAREYFAKVIDTYIALDLILNEIFENGAPELARHPHAAVAEAAG
jgi:hypothetical protein